MRSLTALLHWSRISPSTLDSPTFLTPILSLRVSGLVTTALIVPLAGRASFAAAPIVTPVILGAIGFSAGGVIAGKSPSLRG